MDFLGIFFIVVVLAISVFATFTNRDIFSPAKFYLFSFILFFGGIATGQWESFTWFLVAVIGVVGVVVVLKESTLTIKGTRESVAHGTTGCSRPVLGKPAFERRTAMLLWIMTAPAILAQVLLVLEFGGFGGYVDSLAFRVQEFRGYGYLTVLISTYAVVNLVYFGSLNARQASTVDWVLFLAHFSGLVAFGLLSSSRGGTLNGFVFAVILYHYQRKRLSMVSAASVAIGFVFIAATLGTIREVYKFEDGVFDTGFENVDSVIKISTLSTGVMPLDILARAELKDLQLGKTFLATLTNIVPRDLWPSKPDTGGVVLTLQYAADDWLGLSVLTPTLLGEFALNFGWILGIGLFLVCYSAMMLWVVSLYKKAIFRESANEYFFDIILYIYVMWTAVALMAGEAANTLLPFFVGKLIPLFIVKKVLMYFYNNKKLQRSF